MKLKNFIGNKNITSNIHRMLDLDLMIFGFFCIGFTDFMLTNKRLIYFLQTIIKNDKAILYFLNGLTVYNK